MIGTLTTGGLTTARIEIRLAGAGGQGLVTAGRILAEAAIRSGKTATQTQVYGPQSRGGASRSDVVIADAAIDYPLADHVDVLVALSPAACERYEPELSPEGVLLADAHATSAGTRPGHIVAIVDAARSIAGNPVVAGVVALGALQALTCVVDRAELEASLEARVASRHRAMNIAALAAGIRLIEEPR